MTDDFQGVWETLNLGETAEMSADVGATIRGSEGDWRDTVRSSLPRLPLGNSRDSQFRVDSLLGRGGMGVVHLAHQAALGRDVAIKTLASNHASREAENALLQEARVMGLVEHPNVVPVHIIGQDDDGRPVIVMKRIDGTAWSGYLDGKTAYETDDPLEFNLRTLVAICRAMSFAHARRVVHRDLKPENVMIGQFGEVYVLDWGLAASLDPESERIPFVGDQNAVVGTPSYMAPEMTVGDGRLVGTHTDVFLVGACAYHALTGQPPNQGRSLFDVMAFSYEGRPRTYPDDLAEELVAVCERAMAHEPADRFASVDELREAVEDFLSHRNSVELAQRAARRLTSLAEQIDRGEPGVHQSFGEARFGFRSALEIWPDNPAAVAGLSRCLEVMIDYELKQENVAGARALLSELAVPNPIFEMRVEDLARELAERGARLEKIAYDYDENVGIGSRQGIVVLMAMAFACAPLVLRIVQSHEVPASLAWITTDAVLLASNAFGLLFAPLIGVFAVVTFRRFRDHKTSRIFALGMLWMYIVGFGARTTSLWAGVPLNLAAAAEAAVFSSGLVMLGLSIDRRLGAAGFAFGAVLIPLVLFPEHVIDIYTVGAVISCLSFVLYDHFRRRS